MPEDRNNRQLPAGWRWVQLGDVCEVVAGQSPPGETYRKTPEGLPFFQGKADFGLRHPIARSWCVAPTKIALPGDILISVRAPVGPTNVADAECCIGRGLAAIRPQADADHEFILASLRLLEKQLAALGSGSTFGAIRITDLESLQIPLPLLNEQKRIAAILNEQMAAVERARAAAEARLEAAKALPAAFLREVFSDFHDTHFPRKKLCEILTLRKEIIHPRDEPSGPATFVGLEHVESTTGKRISSVPIEMSQLTGRKPRFHRGDIVYGYLRPYLNKVWIAEFDGLCSVDQYVYSVSTTQADIQYVAWFMRSSAFLTRAPVENAPAWLPRIRIEELAETEINLPALQEQHRIAKGLNEQMASANRARKVIEEELDTINRLPAALLRRAFSGEL